MIQKWLELLRNKTRELAATKDTNDSLRSKKTVDHRKPIFNIIYIFLGLFVLMAGYFSYYIMVRSDEVINNAYNKRQEVLSERFVRGQILSTDRQILAET